MLGSSGMFQFVILMKFVLNHKTVWANSPSFGMVTWLIPSIWIYCDAPLSAHNCCKFTTWPGFNKQISTVCLSHERPTIFGSNEFRKSFNLSSIGVFAFATNAFLDQFLARIFVLWSWLENETIEFVTSRYSLSCCCCCLSTIKDSIPRNTVPIIVKIGIVQRTNNFNMFWFLFPVPSLISSQVSPWSQYAGSRAAREQTRKM